MYPVFSHMYTDNNNDNNNNKNNNINSNNNDIYIYILYVRPPAFLAVNKVKGIYIQTHKH